jgi:hypothetical protein
MTSPVRKNRTAEEAPWQRNTEPIFLNRLGVGENRLLELSREQSMESNRPCPIKCKSLKQELSILVGIGALIKKKIKFSSYIGKFRVEQLQSHI